MAILCTTYSQHIEQSVAQSWCSLNGTVSLLPRMANQDHESSSILTSDRSRTVPHPGLLRSSQLPSTRDLSMCPDLPASPFLLPAAHFNSGISLCFIRLAFPLKPWLHMATQTLASRPPTNKILGDLTKHLGN